MLRYIKLGQALLNMEMYERWGGGRDPLMNKELEKGNAYAEEQGELKEQLQLAIKKTDSKCLAEWADAHVQLLKEFLEDCLHNPQNKGTEIYVARGEIRAWKELKEGRRNWIDRNYYYIHYNPDLYKSLFGIELYGNL